MILSGFMAIKACGVLVVSVLIRIVRMLERVTI
jgi:hypothetical protein